MIYDIGKILYDLRTEVGQPREIKDVGDNFMVTCPFHNNGREKHPSLGILKRKNNKADAGHAHCFTCGYSADLKKFVGDVLGVGAVGGEEWLKDKYIFGYVYQRASLDLDFDRIQEEKKENKVIDYSQYNILNNRAITYLNNRNISEKIIKLFSIGYDSDNDSIVIPIFDRVGQVVMIKKRSIEKKIFFNSVGRHKSELIFGLYQTLKFGDIGKPVWVCESEIDAMTVWEYGGQAVAIMGSHISDSQLRILEKANIRKLVDGLDRDDAGRVGARLLKDKAIPKGFRIYNVRGFGNKKDINDLSKQEFDNLEFY